MSVQGDLVAALMARVEGLSGWTIVWPRKGGEQPAEEHVRVALVPNDNIPADLSTDVMQRRGFLVLTLVSPIGAYQVVSENAAGAIAAHFPRGLRLIRNGLTVKIVRQSVRQAREESGRWETPIWIEYEAWG